MKKVIMKCFRVEGTTIPVMIFPDGEVNIGSTGNISAKDFARLAHAVLAESNILCDNFVGFTPDINGSRLEDF